MSYDYRNASVSAVRPTGLNTERRKISATKANEEKVTTQKPNTTTVSGRGYA